MSCRWILIAISLVFTLSGCVGYTLVKGGERVEIAEKISVTPGQDWNRMEKGKVEYWTLDGLLLQRITFLKGIEDGEILFETGAVSTDSKKEFPRYRKGMTAIEIRELFEETMTRLQAQKIIISNFAPESVGGKSGFRFEFTFKTKDGLNMVGNAAGTVFNDKLFMAIYFGTQLEYYQRGKAGFDAIIASLKLG